ncbi:MAG TPA: uracil-DNA glycosylase [Thermoanaerobaculia bacterium]|nr:uracil-DNA glycosylase [Thermoanaerobaculia bacterium]
MADDSRENLDEIRFFRDLGFREIYVAAPAAAGAAPPPPSRLARSPSPEAGATRARETGRDAVPFDPSSRPVVPAGFSSLPALAEFAAGCPRCKLSASRTHLVFGQGNAKADLMFVGEAPGADEDAQGLAFVGRAGQLLTKIIEAIGMTRDDVFIANVLKCRPPENRNPEADEVAACLPYLREQIRLISPRIIVTLGTFATQAILETELSIGRLRGRFHPLGPVRVMPTYHPAFLLRSPERKKDVWEDMKKVRDALQE